MVPLLTDPAHWVDEFDSRARERELNGFDHFHVDVPTAIAVFANHFVPEGEPPR